MTPNWRTVLVACVASAALSCVASAQLRPAGPELDLPATSSNPYARLAADGYGNLLLLQGGSRHDITVHRLDSLGRPRPPSGVVPRRRQDAHQEGTTPGLAGCSTP
jgi:hypothetical protein